MNSIRVERIFRSLDTNESGTLSRTELVDLFMLTPGEHPRSSLIMSVDRLFDQAHGSHKIDAVSLREFIDLFAQFEKREGQVASYEAVKWFEGFLPHVKQHGSGVPQHGVGHGKKKLPAINAKRSEAFRPNKSGAFQKNEVAKPFSGSSSLTGGHVHGRGQGGYELATRGLSSDKFHTSRGESGSVERPNSAVMMVVQRAAARRAQWEADKANGIDPARGKNARKGSNSNNKYRKGKMGAAATPLTSGPGLQTSSRARSGPSEMPLPRGAQVRAAALAEASAADAAAAPAPSLTGTTAYTTHSSAFDDNDATRYPFGNSGGAH